MSIAPWSSGKWRTRPSGKETSVCPGTSAQGCPAVSYSIGSSMKAPSYQPATTLTWMPSGSVASATSTSFAASASATLRTSPRRKASPTSPAVPSATARRSCGPRSRGLAKLVATECGSYRSASAGPALRRGGRRADQALAGDVGQDSRDEQGAERRAPGLPAARVDRQAANRRAEQRAQLHARGADAADLDAPIGRGLEAQRAAREPAGADDRHQQGDQPDGDGGSGTSEAEHEHAGGGREAEPDGERAGVLADVALGEQGAREVGRGGDPEQHADRAEPEVVTVVQERARVDERAGPRGLREQPRERTSGRCHARPGTAAAGGAACSGARWRASIVSAATLAASGTAIQPRRQ